MAQIGRAEIEQVLLGRSADFGTTLAAGQVALRGRCLGASTPLGLSVNLHDAFAETSFETRMTRPANLMLHLVLEGSVSAHVDGTAFCFGRSKGGPVQLVLSATAQPTDFRRRFTGGQRLRKATIALSWDWLARHELGMDDVLEGRAHRYEAWPVPQQEIAQAEALLAPMEEGTRRAARVLEQEAFALSLVRFAMASLLHVGPDLTRAERDRLARMEAFASAPGPMPELDLVARSGGISVSTMRRMFEKAYGQTVKARLREVRMEKAAAALRAGASVLEAAHVAGYETPAAFATAFRKAKGMPPSHLARTPRALRMDRD
ncbi:helix-turn-helix transcriptional regulator [Alloyangia pacifica]|uniref:helix-turn-helix transcriptional regulator n=1 Tax=Alloyangia pacifica TaxID=311180 RepID=UPI001CD37C86|nr:helix-turn-helix transcriptional regulator [Alloyangia pacifica]MCA0997293.1 helix-turn-helix transcriptional regulator [Alloyangia pacifica]